MGLFEDLFGKKNNDDDEERHVLQFNEDGTTEEHEETEVFRVTASNPIANMTIQIDIETDRPVKIKKFSIQSTSPNATGGSSLSTIIDAIKGGKLSNISPEALDALIATCMGGDPSGELIKGIQQHGMPPLEYLEDALKPGGFLDNNPIAEYMYYVAKEAPEWERDKAVMEYLEEIKRGPVPEEGCDCYACEAKRKAKGEPLHCPINEESTSEEQKGIEINLDEAERGYRKEIDDLEDFLNDND